MSDSEAYSVRVIDHAPIEASVGLTKLPDIREKMVALGAEPLGGTAAQLAEVIRSDIAKYKKIVAAAKIAVN